MCHISSIMLHFQWVQSQSDGRCRQLAYEFLFYCSFFLFSRTTCRLINLNISTIYQNIILIYLFLSVNIMIPYVLTCRSIQLIIRPFPKGVCVSFSSYSSWHFDHFFMLMSIFPKKHQSSAYLFTRHRMRLGRRIKYD